ncbi:hypothetical protein UY3_16562, partial [Chelonia mydas]
TTTLPALVRTPTLMMQPSLDIKPFMSFPVDSSSAVGLFPNFNTMDPVQKAVINHTFGVSIPPKKKQVISCNVCQLRFNSDVSIVIFFLAVCLINPNIFSQLNPLQFCPHLCQPFTMTFCPLAREFVMASHTVIFNFFWYVVVYMLTLSCLTMTATTRVNLPKEQKDLASNLRLLSVV